jgi:hypothetical protein
MTVLPLFGRLLSQPHGMNLYMLIFFSRMIVETKFTALIGTMDVLWQKIMNFLLHVNLISVTIRFLDTNYVNDAALLPALAFRHSRGHQEIQDSKYFISRVANIITLDISLAAQVHADNTSPTRFVCHARFHENGHERLVERMCKSPFLEAIVPIKVMSCILDLRAVCFRETEDDERAAANSFRHGIIYISCDDLFLVKPHLNS